MSEVTQEEKTFGMLSHLCGVLYAVGLGLIGLIGLIVLWMMKKDTMPFVNDQGKEALNFQISFILVAIAATIVYFILAIIFAFVSETLVMVWFGVFVLAMVALFIGFIAFSVIAGLKAKDGIAYRYPYALRLIK